MNDADDAPLEYRSNSKHKVRLREKFYWAGLWIKAHARFLVATAIVFLLIAGVLAWMAYPYVSANEAFRRSRPELEAYAARVRTEGPAALKSPPRELGYFRVYKIESLPHGFLFASDYGNPFDWTGIAYSTEPLPREERDAEDELQQSFLHIDGNWYWVER